MFQVMEITLLRQMLEELGEPMTQEEINTAAACFICYGMSLAEAQTLVLLNALGTAVGGGGGGGAALDVTGDPNGVLTADHNQFAWDSTNDVLWVHEGADGTNTGWHQIV